MKVRRMLTEILLEVTDSEVYDIARNVYNKAKSSASKGRFKNTCNNLQYCILVVTFINIDTITKNRFVYQRISLNPFFTVTIFNISRKRSPFIDMCYFKCISCIFIPLPYELKIKLHVKHLFLFCFSKVKYL